MSDDTPTEAFDPKDEDAPTRRMPQQPADAPTEFLPTAGATASGDTAPGGFGASGESQPPVTPEEPGDSPAAPKRFRALLITLGVVGVLLIGAIIALVVLINSDDTATPVATETATATATPSASPTSSASASATPTASSTPSASATPTVEPSVSPSATPIAGAAAFTAFSPEDGGIVSCPDETTQHPLEFSWTSTGAAEAWFGTGTSNAKADPDTTVDPNATYTEATFDCGVESEIYTVTLDNGSGKLTHKTVTIERVLSY